MHRQGTLTLVLIAGSAALGFLGAWWSRGATVESAGKAAPASLEPWMRSLEAELREVRAALVRREGAPAAIRKEEEQAPEEDLHWRGEVLDRLDRLDAALERLEQWTSDAALRPGSSPAKAKDPAAIDAAAAVVLRDRELARREHFGWTPRMVYERYGVPDNAVDSQEWGTMWYYAGPEGNTLLTLKFADGLVVDVW